jgi:RNA polymerase sigma factor (sigma-70 family)
MSDRPPLPPHLEMLYAELAPQLPRIVGANLTAPGELINDACQVAWGALMLTRDEILPGGELGWLSTTATREVLHQLRRLRHEVSYDDEVELEELEGRADPAPEPDRLAELRERLAEIHQLPARQQRMVWMHGFGYEYGEIADFTGDSRRTVERQLLRAKRRLARPA